jgi:hypothetical protein
MPVSIGLYSMCAYISMPSVVPVSLGLDVCLSPMPSVVPVSLGLDVCLSLSA